ncbi:MAG: hypothetical protein OFPII_27110 [Osedax symbiont Rs1]|nr:MAG: hypothetical protein OFPII_27110 [Osedax symbiont Rs1]
MPSSHNSKVTIEQIIKKLPSRFQPDQAGETSAIFQFKITDKFPFYFDISNQECRIHQSEHEDPNITLTMREHTFIALMSGDIDGMSAFMKGDLKAQGNVILATSLSKLFKRKAADRKKLST